MKSYALSHLSDQVLLRDLATLVAQDRGLTVALLAHIAEVDARRLYLPAAYPSMFLYCVHELHLSEDAAAKRIHAARAARRFPAIFDALAEGRLHLSAVVLLAPHLTEETADELLAAATHRPKSEIEQLLAERFPRQDVPGRVQGIPPCSLALTADQHAPGHVDEQLSPGNVGEQPPSGKVEALADRPRPVPLGPQRFALQFTIEQAAHDDLVYAQELLSHQIPSGDVAEVFARALKALIPQLEKRKFAATSKPQARRGHATTGTRHIPAHVRRTVWQRDGGQCTFESEAGRRCPSRKFLEFDHIDEVARGGKASVDRMRLRCRAHNQYAAECTFGTEFMRHKRCEAAEARAAAKARTAAEARESAQQRAAAEAREAAQRLAAAETREASKLRAEIAARAKIAAAEVIPWLRRLQIPAGEARLAAAPCENIPDAPLQERVRLALSCLRPRTTGPGRAAVSREAPASLAGAGPIRSGVGQLANS